MSLVLVVCMYVFVLTFVFGIFCHLVASCAEIVSCWGHVGNVYDPMCIVV